jgi:diguanylate cyclase (GGDEF)-like protein
MATELVEVEELFEITIHQPDEISGIMAEAKELLTIQSLSKVRELEEKSQHDGLTGARNRAYFDDTLQREFYLSSQHALPLTIAMIDLDHFKKINDTFGHIAGDALLIATVRTIIGQVRHDDTLCRYGGEEFALILPGTTLSAARKLLARLKDSIAAISHQLDDGRIVKVTASIGVVANMDGNAKFECPDDLVKAADSALYAAKHAGRNQIIEWNNSLPSFN